MDINCSFGDFSLVPQLCVDKIFSYLEHPGNFACTCHMGNEYFKSCLELRVDRLTSLIMGAKDFSLAHVPEVCRRDRMFVQ